MLPCASSTDIRSSAEPWQGSASAISTATSTRTALNRNQACLTCRQRKKKCDGTKPVCTPCTRLDYACKYGKTEKRRMLRHGSPPSNQDVLFALDHDDILRIDSQTEPSNNSKSWSATKEANYVSSSSPELASAAAMSCPTRAKVEQNVPSGPAVIAKLPNTMAMKDYLTLPETIQDVAGYSEAFFDNFLNQTAQTANLEMADTSLNNLQDWSFRDLNDKFSENTNFVYEDITLDPHMVLDTPEPKPFVPMMNLPITMPYGISERQTTELYDIFFNHLNPLLPSLNKRCFLKDIHSDNPIGGLKTLHLVVLGVAASAHPDPQVKECSERWLAEANILLQQAINAGAYSVKHIQAALWLTFHRFLQADISETWVLLGTAYRMACPLGLHQMDRSKKGFTGFAPPPKTAFEREERRKTMWAIYILDRCLTFVCGWPHAIDHRQFVVNIPIDEEIFQGGDEEAISKAHSEPCPNLRFMADSSHEHNLYGYICKVAFLLGLIVEHNNLPEPERDLEDQKQDFVKLESALSRLRQTIPSKYTDIDHTACTQQGNLIWLSSMLNACAILLHHPTVSNSTAEPEPKPIDCAQPKSESPAFLRCIVGVKNILALVKDLISTTSQSLFNPFIGSIFFLCGRILVVQWLEGKDDGVRAEIDLILLTLDRMANLWGPLAAKYKTSILLDFSKGPKNGRAVNASKGKYVAPMCEDVVCGDQEA